MLKLHNIHKWYSDKHVLKGVDLECADEEIVGVVGPSGSGKSVLLKIIANAISPEDGLIEGSQATKGVLFQEGALFDSMSVIQNVAFPLFVSNQQSLSHDEVMQNAYEILRSVGLSKAINKLPGQLSGGMRRRVGIARALVAKPKIVLLDDPTGGLDPVAASLIMKLIVDLHRELNSIVLIVSHDIRRLLPAVDRVVALFDGKIVSDLETRNVESQAPSYVVDYLRTRYDFGSEVVQG